MFLKIDNETIIGHSTKQIAGYGTEIDISAENLAPNSEYVYKYVGGDLLALSSDEKAVHPSKKKQVLFKISNQSFSERMAILPDYKITNALQGIDDYDAAIVTSYKNTVNAFRVEYYRVKTAIDAAATEDDMDVAIASVNFPPALLP